MKIFLLFIFFSAHALALECEPKSVLEKKLLGLSYSELTLDFQKLIGRGINPNICDQFGSTPLNIAAFWNHPKMVEFLLTVSRTDVNARDQFGWPPLSNAVARWNVQIVQLLVESPKTTMDVIVPKDQNVLHIHANAGASLNNAAITQILLPHVNAAMMNGRNDRGLTPLHLAIKTGKLDLVNAFLATGLLDLSLPSPAGLSYGEFAREENQNEIAKVIEAYVD